MLTTHNMPSTCPHISDLDRVRFTHITKQTASGREKGFCIAIIAVADMTTSTAYLTLQAAMESVAKR